MRINLYKGKVRVTYAYNSTYDVDIPTGWALDTICTLPDAISCEVKRKMEHTS